jgi:hypothetical protein
MSLADDIRTVLIADDDLMDVLTGGVYTGVEEVSRQNTSGAFDATTKEIKPCALVKLGTEFKLGDTRRGVRTPITIYFYERQGYASIDQATGMVFELLNEAKVGENTWNIQFQNAVYQQRDQALDCALETLRFVAARLR